MKDGPENMSQRYGPELFETLTSDDGGVEDRRILDLGAGDSFGLPYGTEAEVVQVDTDIGDLYDGREIAHELEERGYRIGSNRAAADGYHLPFQDDSFDSVVACASAKDQYDTGILLSASDAGRVLQEGGQLIIGSGKLRGADPDTSLDMYWLSPLEGAFDSVYKANDRVLVLDEYTDPVIETMHEPDLGPDEIEDRLDAYTGTARFHDLAGDHPYDSSHDLRDQIVSQIAVMNEQFPRFDRLPVFDDTAAAAAIEVQGGSISQVKINGEEHAQAWIDLGIEGEPAGSYRIDLSPD